MPCVSVSLTCRLLLCHLLQFRDHQSNSTSRGSTATIHLGGSSKSQFFDYQGTPKDDRIMVASFYLDGAALSWFQWMFQNGFITLWPALLQATESRFAPSIYDDPRGALFKLTQRGTVTEYLTEFEKLANRITSLSPSVLLSCFISGLSQEIRREVQAFQPASLPKATALARLQEDKINDRRKHTRTPFIHPSPNTTSFNPHSTQPPRPKAPFVQRTQEDARRGSVIIVMKNGAPPIVVKGEFSSSLLTPTSLHHQSQALQNLCLLQRLNMTKQWSKLPSLSTPPHCNPISVSTPWPVYPPQTPSDCTASSTTLVSPF